MYRNEWDAAMARAAALEAQLRHAQATQQGDAATIAQLTQALAAAHADLARLRGGYGAAPGYGAGGVFYEPRGSTILILGILSLVVCGILGPIAWSMGNTELQRIDAGQVDPSTRGNVTAGRICGMIATILMIVSFVGIVIMFAALAGSSHY